MSSVMTWIVEFSLEGSSCTDDRTSWKRLSTLQALSALPVLVITTVCRSTFLVRLSVKYCHISYKHVNQRNIVRSGIQKSVVVRKRYQVQ